ncbi:MAG: hypothetical protein ACXVJB_09255, partial [Mucilaginibacter sp.]
MKNLLRIGNTCLTITFLFISVCAFGQDHSPVVNDITQLNPIKVSAIITPKTNDEIISAVKEHTGPISIGGGRYSM